MVVNYFPEPLKGNLEAALNPPKPPEFTYRRNKKLWKHDKYASPAKAQGKPCRPPPNQPHLPSPKLAFHLPSPHDCDLGLIRIPHRTETTSSNLTPTANRGFLRAGTCTTGTGTGTKPARPEVEDDPNHSSPPPISCPHPAPEQVPAPQLEQEPRRSGPRTSRTRKIRICPHSCRQHPRLN